MSLFSRDTNIPPPSLPIDEQPKVLFRVMLVVAVPTDVLGRPVEGTAARYVWAHDVEEVVRTIRSLPPDHFKTDDGRVVEVLRIALVTPGEISADLVLNSMETKSIIN